MKHLSLVLFALALRVLGSPIRGGSTDATLGSRAPSGTKDVIIQMFEWTWDSIASEVSHCYGFVC